MTRDQETLAVTLWNTETNTSLTCAERNPFDGMEEADEKLRYLWGPGSYGCDCNRRGLWIRTAEGATAARESDHDAEHCGRKRYRVLVVREDGRIVLNEIGGPRQNKNCPLHVELEVRVVGKGEPFRGDDEPSPRFEVNHVVRVPLGGNQSASGNIRMPALLPDGRLIEVHAEMWWFELRRSPE